MPTKTILTIVDVIARIKAIKQEIEDLHFDMNMAEQIEDRNTCYELATVEYNLRVELIQLKQMLGDYD